MKIFWSWQSDTQGKTGRFLVRDALKDAIEELKEAPEIEEPDREALHLDHDIQNVTGSPDLARTIFGKIETSEVVIADVTVVGQTFFNADGEKKLINSNVAIELGYALHACTDQRVLLVFNEYYGSHKDLPFDLRHKGGAIVFNLAPNAGKMEIEAQKKILKNRFVQALRPLLERKARRPMIPMEETRFSFNKAAYFGAGEVLAQPDCAYQGGGERLCYLRLIPKAAPTIPIEFATLKDVALAAPLLRDGNYESVLHDVNRYGAIKCTSSGSRLTASTQLFQNGEIWCTSACLIKTKRENGVPQYINLPYVSIFCLEQIYYDTVRALFKFAAKELKFEPPWNVELGLCETSGLYLNVGNAQEGPVRTAEIIQRTSISDSANATIDKILLSFFSKVFDCAGERRPPNLYGFPPYRPNAAQK